MLARIEMKAVGGDSAGRTLYEPKLRTRDGDLISNDAIVVITDGIDAGGIGIIAIEPNRETVTVKLGCTHVNVVLDEVRTLKMGEKVVNPR